MIEIDGSEGEGGGQILRSSLSLAICTQQAFRIANIRANREKPGLMRQHLTAVRAAAEICKAQVDGAELGARALTFRPGRLAAGDYSFAIGTAGSCTLVFQTVLPALLTATGESRVRITGGTHNRGSPPFDFLARSFLPLLGRMGAQRAARPHASWILSARRWRNPRAHRSRAAARRIEPEGSRRVGARLRGSLRGRDSRCTWPSASSRSLAGSFGGRGINCMLRGLPNDVGPGNALTITLEHENVIEVFTGFGEKGVRAEDVAEQAAAEAGAYLSAMAPVGEHLADQLLLPMALRRGRMLRAPGSSRRICVPMSP